MRFRDLNVQELATYSGGQRRTSHSTILIKGLRALSFLATATSIWIASVICIGSLGIILVSLLQIMFKLGLAHTGMSGDRILCRSCIGLLTTLPGPNPTGLRAL